MPKKKYYVVWKGVEPGVYDSWIECKRQIDGYEGAIYKSFETKDAAEEAYPNGPWEYIGKSAQNKKKALPLSNANIVRDSLAVDAACSGNPGKIDRKSVV